MELEDGEGEGKRKIGWCGKSLEGKGEGDKLGLTCKTKG